MMFPEGSESSEVLPQLKKREPISRFESLKSIGSGFGVLLLAALFIFIGIIPIFITAIFIIGGPFLIFTGMVQLLMPKRMHGSELHENIESFGALGIVICMVAFVIWLIWFS